MTQMFHFRIKIGLLQFIKDMFKKKKKSSTWSHLAAYYTVLNDIHNNKEYRTEYRGVST